MAQAQEKEKVIEDRINSEFADTDTPVHKFEEGAPPEDKAKQTLEDSGGSKPLATNIGPTAKKIVTDTDGNQSTESETNKSTVSTLLPGSIPSAVESIEIPEWARTGWQHVASLNSTDTEKDFFDEILGEKYLGKLWLNAAVVFISVFVTYIITSLGGGIGWVIIISAFVGTYFKNSVQRFYRNARNEISRELAKEKLELYEEPAEWINEFLRRFWLIYEPILSSTIVKTADSILAASTPSFLDSIRLTTFTLGSKPVIIESIKSYPKTDDDVVVMDWRISYIPNDIVNMTRAQLTTKVNPKIVLTIRLGKGMVGAGIPVLLEDMSFSGLIRVKLKLINTFPHIKTIDISFLEEPKLDYVLKPIGGDTFGFDIANLPGLSSFILDQVHATLRPMMYDPNVYTLDAELLMGGYPIETAIGVLRLTIFGAKGLRNAERFGTSDPYIKIKVHGNQELARTKVIEDSLNPVWNETHFLVLTTLNEFLKLEIWDFNGMSKDKPLGTSNFELKILSENPKQENISTPVLYEGKPHGDIKFDAVWNPVAEVKEGEPAPESNVGILRFNIHQVKNLDHRRNAYAELLLNGKVVHKTKTLKRSNNPTWEEPFEMFITNRTGSKLAVNVRDERDLANDPIIGKWESTLDQFLANSKAKIDWFTINETRGRINLTGLWKPVLVDNIPEPGRYAEPRGFVRLHVKNAKELKNLAQIGKSDPYTKILLDSTVRGRTETINDNLNPIWDEIFYVPVHSTRETLFLQVWDREINAKDKRLGFTELELSKLIKKQEDGTFEAAENIDTSSPLLLDRESRGSINYSAAFYPTIKEKESGNINILDHQSGILVVHINKAKLDKSNTSVDVYVDNGSYPVYTTNRCKTINPEYNEVTDIFVKELDFARISFQIKYGDNKNPIGIAESDVKDLLEKCLESSQEEGLDIPINEMNNATFNVYIRYIPVKYTLQPSESINNMGNLQITIKNAENLPAADRSGTSDPYIVFILNGEKVHKTKTIKKNCNPEFNDNFEVTVLSRTASIFEVEIFDWNQIGNDKKIASGKIQLDDLPVFERAEKKIQLKNEMKSATAPGGVLNLHFVFRPSFIMRKKQNSGIVTGATKALTGIGTGIGTGVGNVGSFVGSGANTVVTGAGNAVSSGFGFLKKK
ncbi:C2 domain-containing protein [Glomus cerebriforme]|uniref:C2 domain-containing protein n=1 Tax=Glomus cerebriforme TaxID=658196 RepID=A0A397S0N3_9GLOM|nr:C2 domain-containing protein [Glomus cerebriforme]